MTVLGAIKAAAVAMFFSGFGPALATDAAERRRMSVARTPNPASRYPTGENGIRRAGS